MLLYDLLISSRTDSVCVIFLSVGKPRAGASDREPVDLGLIVKIFFSRWSPSFWFSSQDYTSAGRGPGSREPTRLRLGCRRRSLAQYKRGFENPRDPTPTTRQERLVTVRTIRFGDPRSRIRKVSSGRAPAAAARGRMQKHRVRQRKDGPDRAHLRCPVGF
jgi:hypothetical protein